MSTSGPFGTWTSPITAQVVATQGLRLGAPVVDGSDVYWLEGRPAEGGRNVLVRRAADGTLRELTPPGFNVRTRVHEYGGGAYVVHRGLVVFSNFADQRLYRLDAGPAAGGALTPVPMTPEGRWHFADAVVDAARNRLVCVREDHTVEGRECVNTLVAVPLDGSGGAGQVLAEGYDFYSTPRLSPDGASAGVDLLAPPPDAVGRHRALGGRRGRRGRADERAPRGRQRDGVESINQAGRPAASCGSSATATTAGGCIASCLAYVGPGLALFVGPGL